MNVNTFPDDETAKSFQQLLDDTDSSEPLPLNSKGLGRSHETSVVQQEVSDANYGRVREGVLSAEVSEDALVQLAWAVVLGRYGAGAEVVFGGSTSVDDGEFGDLSNIAGPSLIRMPVEVKIDLDQTVCEALKIRQSAMAQAREAAMLEDQSLPKELFQTGITYHRDQFISHPSDEGGQQRRQFQSTSCWNCPLSLLIVDDGNSLSASLNYDTGLYNSHSAIQLLDDYCHILVELTKNLDQPLRELDVLSPVMRERLIDQQCAREQMLTHPTGLTRIMAQCDARPHDVAINDFHGSSVTYGQLKQRVMELAQTLHGCGVRKGDIVAIHIQRSIEAVVSVLATHAAGAAFLPLDTSSPADRRIFTLEDASVRLVLMDGVEDLDTDVQKLRMDLELDPKLRSPVDDLPSDPTPADGLAYVIYTSGSTGKPKGVCIEHSSLANHIEQVTKLYKLTPADRCLQFMSLSFDPSIEEMFVSLSSGANIWLRSDEMVNSARAFFSAVEKTNQTMLTLTTAFWHQLVHSQLPWPDSVRLVLVGGERVDPGMHASFRESAGPELRFINAYGPTEITIACACYDDAEGDHDSTVLPIGRPMGGASCFVLDENLVPVPPGVDGQLYVGGAGLARGYLNRAALTAERFIAHPFRPNSRLYATGDVVRHTAKGNLVYIDRIDNQVKVQGFRVELGEIENRLRSHEAVEEAVVIPKRSGGTTRIVAFVQAPNLKPADGDHLRKFVADALPVFMVPRRVEVLPLLPQTTTGKVNRQALTAISTEMPKQAAATQPAAEVDDPLQKTLLRIWSEVLKEPISDPKVDFFMAGGDSLLAVRLFVEIERELHVQCNPQKFFKEPTVEALAKLIEVNDKTDFKAPLLTIAHQPADVRPLFFAPTISGQASDYIHLSELLKGVVPMYGLQMRGLQEGERVYDDLRDAAEFYIERMREIQPKGPYRLAGYSAAGTICLAIAEALHDQGETTDPMLMLDAIPLGIHIASPFSSPRRLWRLGGTMIDRVKELFEEEDNFFKNLIDRSRPVVQRLWAKVWPSAEKPTVDVRDLFIRSGQSELTSEEATRMQTHLDSIIDFQPRRLPLDVVLVRGLHDQLAGPFELDLCWKQAVTGDIQVEVLPLRHHDFLDKKHIELVAEIMKTHLSSHIDRPNRPGVLADTDCRGSN